MLRKITLLLMCALTISAADRPTPNNTTDTEKALITILQRLTLELNETATTDYNDGLAILKTMMASCRVHSPGCTHHTTTIIGSAGSSDFIKGIFRKPEAKYKFVETSLNKATEQFLKFKNVAAAYKSLDVILCTAFFGTKPMFEHILSVKEVDDKISMEIIESACFYGNVEAVEYVTQKLPVHTPTKEIPSVLDALKMPNLQPGKQQELIRLKNIATIRFEYMLHKNPDTQKTRKTCPFEECKRLLTEAIKSQKTT